MVSPLRPHCLAVDRLHLWQPPVSARSASGLLSLDAARRILHALRLGYADSTAQTYGSGLLVFHVFCDAHHFSEEERSPVHLNVLESFISCLLGFYSASAVSNIVAGVHAWHVIHGLRWCLDPAEQQVFIRAADRLAPPGRSKRAPLLVDHLLALAPVFDLSVSLDAAFWAALLAIFWCTARCGEFLVPRLDGFDAQVHVQRQHMRRERQAGQDVLIFALPWTKTTRFLGAEVFCGAHDGLADPFKAFDAHFSVNSPQDSESLFAHSVNGKRRVLTPAGFRARLKLAAAAAGISLPLGHSARIGSLLWYLLNGMPFAEAMAKGRWQSTSSFHLYLRKHTQVLAPHLEQQPNLYSELHTRVVE